MPDHLAHGFAARAQIGARIEGFGALRKQGPDGGGDLASIVVALNSSIFHSLFMNVNLDSSFVMNPL